MEGRGQEEVEQRRHPADSEITSPRWRLQHTARPRRQSLRRQSLRRQSVRRQSLRWQSLRRQPVRRQPLHRQPWHLLHQTPTDLCIEAPLSETIGETARAAGGGSGLGTGVVTPGARTEAEREHPR